MELDMVRMIKRGMMVSLSLMLIIGCAKEKNSAQLQSKLAIGYIPNMQFTPLYVAMEQGLFGDKGLDIKLEYGFGNDLISLVTQSKVDFALVDADQFLVAKHQGLPIQAIFQYYEILPTAILTLNKEIKEPKDLIGKNIGVPELFGASYLTLLEFLRYYQIDLEDVNIVRVGYAQLAALESGEVDAAVVFANNEPVILGAIPYTLWSSETFSSLAGSLIIVNENLNNDAIIAFQEGLEQAIRWVRNSPQEAAAIAIKFVDGADFDETLKGIYATLAFYSEHAAVDEQRLQFTYDQLIALNLL